ncbi:hypothetical protein Tco_1175304 [Tanacetum coccineum]
MKHSYSNDDTCFSNDVIDEILEEDFNALLNEGSKILHSIEGTLLEEEIFIEFDEFMAMTADENSDSESNTKNPPFEKITINTDYKIKTSLEEPPIDLKLKPIPENLEYVLLEEPSFLLVIISSQLSKEKKTNSYLSLKSTSMLLFGKQQIFLEVVKKEIVKLLDTGIIYPIADSPWVSPIHCVPKKGGITVGTNENDELVPTRSITGESFVALYALDTFQGVCLAIFHDMIEESVKVFMDNFSAFGNSFNTCLNNLDKMLQRCEDAHLVLNVISWSKKELCSGQVSVLLDGIGVDKAKTLM